jgi:hypothetical protein
MQFPMSFSDICLLLAFTSIVLLITTELVPPHYKQTNLLINKKRLKITAIAFDVLFLTAVILNLTLNNL